MQNAPPKKPRVLLITTIASPFWSEFARAVAKRGIISFRMAVTSNDLDHRGPHWGHADGLEEGSVTFSGGHLAEWLSQQFSQYDPHFVILGRLNFAAEPIARRLSRASGALFGYFVEQPTPRRAIARALYHAFYRVRLASRRPDFILAVGDRAQGIYRRLTPSGCPVVFFPYYQDLSATSRTKGTRPSAGKVTFLFSGRLLKRNAIKEMTTAFERLAETHAGRFRWCVSAHGPEEKWIRDAMARSAILKEAIFFDRDFTAWEDRLKPFLGSDVLLVPAKHSGWGLVVPEALAAGLPVIATRYVEAARYYVDDFMNGMFVEPTADSILESLRLILDCPDVLERLKTHTRESAMKGDAPVGAERLETVVTALLRTPTP